jgi:hypothetical protein
MVYLDLRTGELLVLSMKNVLSDPTMGDDGGMGYGVLSDFVADAQNSGIFSKAATLEEFKTLLPGRLASFGREDGSRAERDASFVLLGGTEVVECRTILAGISRIN